MKIKKLIPLLTILSILTLPACLGNDEYTDYSVWRELNTNYIDSISKATENGRLVYTPIVPNWDNSFTVYVRWHNTREENASLITPFSTSTCHVKYTLTDIDGDTLDSSASFTCVPNNLVTGFMATLTNMCVKDTVTTVIPYMAGYGAYGSSSIPPFTTLIFGIRLDSISKWM